MFRWLVILAIAGGLAYCGATVKLGQRTFFGHIRAIWATDEVQDLKEGVKDKAGPTAKRIKRGVEKGIEAATEDDDGSSGASKKPALTPAPAPGP